MSAIIKWTTRTRELYCLVHQHTTRFFWKDGLIRSQFAWSMNKSHSLERKKSCFVKFFCLFDFLFANRAVYPWFYQ